MSESLKFILAITCIVPAAAGVIFYRRISKHYHPLIYILLLAVVTEVLQELNRTSHFITNAFILINMILHLWLFYDVGVIKNKKNVFIYFVIFLLVYLGDGIYEGTILKPYVEAAIASYIIILQLCIKGIGLQTFKESIWIKDGLFIFYAINIIYSVFLVFTFSLRFFGVKADSLIGHSIADIHNYVNAASYLLTLWAVLCLRKKVGYMA
jgi:hypothetical protein